MNQALFVWSFRTTYEHKYFLVEFYLGLVENESKILTPSGAQGVAIGVCLSLHSDMLSRALTAQFFTFLS